MRIRKSFAVCTIALSACGAAKGATEQRLLSHDWSPKLEFCDQLFVRFTRTALELHPQGKPVTKLRIWDIVVPPDQPETVMLVDSPDDVQTRPTDDKLGAFLLDLSGNRMKLIAQGSPNRLLPVSPDNINARRFDLVACPAR
jgi:hypothetical protein